MKNGIFTALRRCIFGLNESEKIQLMILQATHDNPGKNLVIDETQGLMMLDNKELELYQTEWKSKC